MSVKLDLIGEKYGKLLVVGKDTNSNKWVLRCDCGNPHTATTNSLRTGSVKSCGCLKLGLWDRNNHPAKGKPAKGRLDLTGEVKNGITILGFEKVVNNRSHWRAQCKCGAGFVVSGKSFMSGNTKSCGCLRNEAASRKGDYLRGKPNKTAREKVEKLVGERFGKIKVTKIEWCAIKTTTNSPETTIRSFGVYDCDCGGTGKAAIGDIKSRKIVTCGCGQIISEVEQEICDFLKEYATVKQQLAIGGFRYDICIESEKLIVEFNGPYWHSGKFISDKKHHYNRRVVAENSGYRLITIWGDDYKRNPLKWKNYLLSTMNKRERISVGARKLTCRIISRDVALSHHLGNHLQEGKPNGALHVGAFLGDTIIGAMTIRRNAKSYEISRYTVLDKYSTPGLFLKLLSYVERRESVTQWVTFCNLDHFDGNLYKVSGFENTSVSIQMTYLKNGNRLRRENYMKCKLPSLFHGDVDMRNTELEICADHKIFPVYNSGIAKYKRDPIRSM